MNALLEDIGDDPNQLPPLQHALMRTFDIWVRQGDPSALLDMKQYEETGKISSALSVHGDDIYLNAGAPTDRTKAAVAAANARRTVIERLFKALTERGADGRRIRRPAFVATCIAATGATKDALLDVVAVFRERRASFLMPPPDVELDHDTALDIAHESLMENWTRLRGWVDEEAASAREYKRLADAAELHAKKRAALWRVPELAAAIRWKKKQRPTKGWADRYDARLRENLRFLKASTAERWCHRFLIVGLIMVGLMFLLALVFEPFFKSRMSTAQFATVENPILAVLFLGLAGAVLGWCSRRFGAGGWFVSCARNRAQRRSSPPR